MLFGFLLPSIFCGCCSGEMWQHRYWLARDQLVQEQRLLTRELPVAPVAVPPPPARQQQQGEEPPLPLVSPPPSPPLLKSSMQQQQWEWGGGGSPGGPCSSLPAAPMAAAVAAGVSVLAPESAVEPQPQQPQQQTPTPAQPLEHGGAVGAAAAAAESPLLSLAAGALPSFSLPPSPDKLPAAGPAQEAEPTASLPLAAGPVGAVAAAADVAATAAVLPAGIPSDSPTHQRHPVNTRWAGSLRPEEQQVWGPQQEHWHSTGNGGGDSSRDGSPSRNREASRPASPLRRQQDSSASSSPPYRGFARPAAPGSHSGASRPASPERYRYASSGSSPGDGQQESASSPASPPGHHWVQQHPQPSRSPSRTPAAAHVAATADGTAEVRATAEKAAAAEEEEEEAAGNSQTDVRDSVAGALTVMVNKAVGRLQQLHELQQLVGDVDLRSGQGQGQGGGQGQGEGPRRSGPCRTSLVRLSLEPALTSQAGSIAELAYPGPAGSERQHLDEPTPPLREGKASGGGTAAAPAAAPDRRDKAMAVLEALRLRRQQQQAQQEQGAQEEQQQARRSADLQRLQHLQQQVEANMAEVRGACLDLCAQWVPSKQDAAHVAAPALRAVTSPRADQQAHGRPAAMGRRRQWCQLPASSVALTPAACTSAHRSGSSACGSCGHTRRSSRVFFACCPGRS